MDSEKRWVVEKINRLAPQAEVYKETIESWINKQDDASITALVELFDDAKFAREYVPYFEAFHFSYLLAQITKGEIKKNLEKRFIRNGHCIAELELIIRKIRFAVWRLEFLDVSAAGKELYELCSEYEISSETLHQIISMNAMFPKKAYLSVAGVFLENGKTEVAKRVVECALETYPGDADFEGLKKLL